MKSKAGKIFGGFTRQAWESLAGQLKEDEKAFIFSLDLLKIYRVAAPSKAVYCHQGWGPSFGGYAMALTADPLNAPNGGRAQANNFKDGVRFNIKLDSEGNHEATGEGKEQEDDGKKFTCDEIEVFQLQFYSQ
jgi:hypothetical protein